MLLRRLRRFSRRSAAAVHPEAPADWSRWLGEVRGELLRLNEVTEQDFLLVGEKLQQALSAGQEISSGCSELVGFLSGPEADRGAQELTAILDRAREMAEQAETNRRALDRMLEGVGRIGEPLADLNARMRTFRVMATLIRIEGARLRQAGVDFETLAEDVRKLAADIEQNSATVLSAALELRKIVREAAVGVADFEKRQKAELPRIREQAAASLAALRERRSRAAQSSAALGRRYEAVRREIGELVMSLQFHDITRQQMEHAAAALDAAERQMAAGGAGLAGRICRLQCAQLEQSRASFVAAVGRARESLAGIARHVSEMAAESTGVLEGGSGTADSFLGEMQHGFAGIRAAITEYAEARFTLSTVAATVAEGVRDMAGFVGAIDEIGTRMQRIALNANIKAIRIGEPGIALGAVADGIQRLAADSNAQTGAVAEGIGLVTEGSERLAGNLGDTGADLVEALDRIMAAFQEADAETRRWLERIGEQGRAVSRELDGLGGAIHADRVLAEGVERSCERLRRIAAEAGSSDTAPITGEQAEIMRQLEAQYTMHAERTVHCETLHEAGPAAAGGEEIGANVELF